VDAAARPGARDGRGLEGGRARDVPADVRCLTTTPDGEATWAYLDVDGLRQGTTPLDLKLDPGDHTLVFQRPGFQPQTRRLTATSGERQTVKVVMGAR
jgi:hypothetical protein